jgi:hypothetical protein
MSVWKSSPTSIVVVLVSLIALGLYLGTMAPSLTLGHGSTDGAELAVAVHTRGIPHPTGYPTYVLLAQAFRAFPWRDLAGRLNLFSAVAAALTTGLVAALAGTLFTREKGPLPAAIAAAVAGLSLTVAGLFWSQALVTEVYTLHTLFLALGLWLVQRWRGRGGIYLPLAGLCLGVGLGNHVSLLFLLPGVACFLACSQPRPRWPMVLLTVGLLVAGLSVYLVLPLRAAADPWLNWNNPRDWASLWAHVSGRSYGGLILRAPWPQAASRVSAAARFLLRDFAPWGALLGLAGLLILGRKDRPLLLLTGIPAALGLLLAVTYGGVESQVHLLTLYVAWALWAGVAAGALATALWERFGARAGQAALLLPLLSFVLLFWHLPTWSLHRDPGPLPEQARVLATLPSGGLLLSDADELTFPLWYAQVVEGTRPDLVVVDVRLLEWPWYRQQLPARYPGLAVPRTASADGWLGALLEANPGRPAFSLDTLPLPAGYSLRSTGEALQVVPP